MRTLSSMGADTNGPPLSRAAGNSLLIIPLIYDSLIATSRHGVFDIYSTHPPQCRIKGSFNAHSWLFPESFSSSSSILAASILLTTIRVFDLLYSV
uniref:Uncharacterized protein n=1 Tax=Caenorhabditis japonica TaxID=281687 RepID=A0A8R1IBX9_CAEJA